MRGSQRRPRILESSRPKESTLSPLQRCRRKFVVKIKCLKQFFSVSIHFSVPQSIFQCLRPPHTTSHLRPRTSDLTPQTIFSVPQSIVQCLNPLFSVSVHVSVTQSIFQCLSPYVSASVHFAEPQIISRCLHLRPHTSHLTPRSSLGTKTG